jgi:hypothetical protein
MEDRWQRRRRFIGESATPGAALTMESNYMDNRFEHIFRWQKERIEEFYLDSQRRNRGDVVIVVMDLEDSRAFALAAVMSSFEEATNRRQAAHHRSDVFALAMNDQTVDGTTDLFYDSPSLLRGIDESIRKNLVPVVVMTEGEDRLLTISKPDLPPKVGESP